MHLALWDIVLVCHQNSIGSAYVDGYGGLSESGLCVFRKWCPIGFLVVGKSTSVVLHSIVMLYLVVYGDDGYVV